MNDYPTLGITVLLDSSTPSHKIKGPFVSERAFIPRIVTFFVSQLSYGSKKVAGVKLSRSL